MANSKLLGTEPLTHAPGHDDAHLGPSDSSDSGSDLAGLDSPDPGDPPPTRAASDAVQTPGGAGDDGSDTAEDASADPVGDGRSDAALAARLPPRQA